jgi:hypothetical protein
LNLCVISDSTDAFDRFNSGKNPAFLLDDYPVAFRRKSPFL